MKSFLTLIAMFQILWFSSEAETNPTVEVWHFSGFRSLDWILWFSRVTKDQSPWGGLFHFLMFGSRLRDGLLHTCLKTNTISKRKTLLYCQI
jgi:hypothetical protein